MPLICPWVKLLFAVVESCLISTLYNRTVFDLDKPTRLSGEIISYGVFKYNFFISHAISMFHKYLIKAKSIPKENFPATIIVNEGVERSHQQFGE